MPSNRKLTKLAKELNVSIEEIKRRYERCISCYWFGVKAGNCAYGEPHEVVCDCVIYIFEKKERYLDEPDRR